MESQTVKVITYKKMALFMKDLYLITKLMIQRVRNIIIKENIVVQNFLMLEALKIICLKVKDIFFQMNINLKGYLKMVKNLVGF